MEKHELLTWFDFNMTSEWSWVIYISKNKSNKSFISGYQVDHDSPDTYNLPKYFFSNASQLKESIQKLFSTDIKLEEIPIDWSRIVPNLKEIDPSLSTDLKKLLAEEKRTEILELKKKGI